LASRVSASFSATTRTTYSFQLLHFYRWSILLHPDLASVSRACRRAACAPGRERQTPCLVAVRACPHRLPEVAHAPTFNDCLRLLNGLRSDTCSLATKTITVSAPAPVRLTPARTLTCNVVTAFLAFDPALLARPGPGPQNVRNASNQVRLEDPLSSGALTPSTASHSSSPSSSCLSSHRTSKSPPRHVRHCIISHHRSSLTVYSLRRRYPRRLPSLGYIGQTVHQRACPHRITVTTTHRNPTPRCPHKLVQCQTLYRGRPRKSPPFSSSILPSWPAHWSLTMLFPWSYRLRRACRRPRRHHFLRPLRRHLCCSVIYCCLLVLVKKVRISSDVLDNYLTTTQCA